MVLLGNEAVCTEWKVLLVLC